MKTPVSMKRSFCFYPMRIFGPLLIIIITVVFPLLLLMLLSISRGRYVYSNFEIFYWIVTLIIMAFLFTMINYSLGRLIFRDPGTTYEALLRLQKHPNPLISETLIHQLPTCSKCGLPKPPRCHHCTHCNRCHLRMDHHCPAIGICVALQNHRDFLVMLHWACVSIAYYFFTIIIFYFETKIEPILIITASVSSFVLDIFLIFFLFQQMGQVYQNRTTIEIIKNDKSIYSLGKEKNFQQMFGDGWYQRFIPGKSSLTGFEWALPQTSSIL